MARAPRRPVTAEYEGSAPDGPLPQRVERAGADFRATEMAWLRDHQDDLARRYGGQWVAIDGPALVAHAGDLATLLALATAKGHPRPLVTAVPADPNLRLYA